MYLFSGCLLIRGIPECKDYPEKVISGYLGKNWGILLARCTVMLRLIWMFVYSAALLTTAPLICILSA